MIEEILPESFECALIDMDHDHLLRKSGGDSDSVKAGHSPHSAQKRPVIGIGISYHRRDVVVDQCPCEHGSLHICNDRQNDTKQNDDDLNAVILEHIAHYSLEKESRILYLGAGSSRHSSPARSFKFLIFFFRHFLRPPRKR